MKKLLVILTVIALFSAIALSAVTLSFTNKLCCCGETYYLTGPATYTVDVSPYNTSAINLIHE